MTNEQDNPWKLYASKKKIKIKIKPRVEKRRRSKMGSGKTTFKEPTKILRYVSDDNIWKNWYENKIKIPYKDQIYIDSFIALYGGLPDWVQPYVTRDLTKSDADGLKYLHTSAAKNRLEGYNFNYLANLINNKSHLETQEPRYIPLLRRGIRKIEKELLSYRHYGIDSIVYRFLEGIGTCNELVVVSDVNNQSGQFKVIWQKRNDNEWDFNNYLFCRTWCENYQFNAMEPFNPLDFFVMDLK